ncbi:MAG TPA: GGDEF domain-containing protein, partial [Rectinemataceae bacterium]
KEVSRLNRYGGSIAFIILDLDRFKDLNDHFGHLAGDKALAAVGALLRSRMRVSDIVGRYGGEEFCILLVDSELAEASLIAEDLRKRIERLEVEDSGKKIRITASFGIAWARGADGKVELEHLLSEADRALYRAKEAGRNRVAS